MPAISFSVMKEKLLSGEKRQTIRPLRNGYWMRFKKGDRLVGYWKMRTKDCEKLFDSTLAQDPFIIKMGDFNGYLMEWDGFENLYDGLESWFYPKYGFENWDAEFVVLRWGSFQGLRSSFQTTKVNEDE